MLSRAEFLFNTDLSLSLSIFQALLILPFSYYPYAFKVQNLRMWPRFMHYTFTLVHILKFYFLHFASGQLTSQ